MWFTISADMPPSFQPSSPKGESTPNYKSAGMERPWPWDWTTVHHSVVSDFWQPCELQHARPPCPSLCPRVCSNSRPLSQQWLTWLQILSPLFTGQKPCRVSTCSSTRSFTWWTHTNPYDRPSPRWASRPRGRQGSHSPCLPAQIQHESGSSSL